MSRHFELMEQMEAERLLGSEALPKASSRVNIPTAAPIVASVPIEVVRSSSATLTGRSQVQAEVELYARPTSVAAEARARCQPPAAERRPAAIPRKPADQQRWANAEASRLVQQIFLQRTQGSPAVVVFAGLDSGNGSSEVCASVAEALARTATKSVCLIEANLRSPGLSGLFGTTNDYGLTESLLHAGPIQSFARQVADENLWLLSSGTVEVSSPSLLATQSLQVRLTELRGEFGYILIDAPPLNRHSDATLLGQLSDGLVMVLGTDTSQRDAASDAASNLRSARVPILAAVLNKGISPVSPTGSI